MQLPKEKGLFIWCLSTSEDVDLKYMMHLYHLLSLQFSHQVPRQIHVAALTVLLYPSRPDPSKFRLSTPDTTRKKRSVPIQPIDRSTRKPCPYSSMPEKIQVQFRPLTELPLTKDQPIPNSEINTVKINSKHTRPKCQTKKKGENDQNKQEKAE